MMATAELGTDYVMRFAEIVGAENVLSTPEERMVYESDGYLIARETPDLIVFPTTTEQVVAVVKLCHELELPVTPRGAGTSLAGGCLPIGGGVMITLTKMTRIIEVNVAGRYAVVEPGVINAKLNQHLKGTGLHFAPDPSSGGASTIGGNVATNAGGPHTLKYGVTTNHVLGLEAVLPDGELVTMGSPSTFQAGFDLRGLFIGSEGSFGLATKIVVKLTPDPAAIRTRLAVFDTLSDATKVVSEMIGRGIVPAALELMDQGMLRAVEEKYGFGLPTDAGAVLIIEVDGHEVSIDEAALAIEEICRDGGAREIRIANTATERQQVWKCRKQAFGAIGRLSTSFCTQDGVVPRTKLPELLDDVIAISKKFDIRIVNVFHAGDGNIHPILLFDERDEGQVQRVLEASEEILDRCIELGGTVTGEHGIGIEKLNFLPKMFTPTDLEVMREVRSIFDPQVRFCGGKVIPAEDVDGDVGLTRTSPGRRAVM